jgi:hypothetical protein
VTNGERAAYDAPIFNRKVSPLPSHGHDTDSEPDALVGALYHHHQMTRVRAELLKHLEKTFA